MSLLLVEGPDDFHVVRNLLRQRGVNIDAEVIHQMDGIEPLLDSLPTYLKSSESAIGVVIDSDWNIAARWQSVSDRARKAGYLLPPSPVSGGTIVKVDGQPTFGIWLMPNNALPGAVEEFVELIIPANDKLWHSARASVESIPENERRFPMQAKMKAQIHTWLAWQEQPGVPMGAAITRRYFEGSSTDVDRFVDWARELLGL